MTYEPILLLFCFFSMMMYILCVNTKVAILCHNNSDIVLYNSIPSTLIPENMDFLMKVISIFKSI